VKPTCTEKAAAKEGKQVAGIRKSLGFTQAELASLFGVHALTISKWERGHLTPRPYPMAMLLAFEQGHKRCPTIGSRVRGILASEGPVAGVHMLLRAAFDDYWSKRRDRKARQRRALRTLAKGAARRGRP